MCTNHRAVKRHELYGPAVFRGLSNRLQAALDTGNNEEVLFVIEAGNNAMEEGVISFSEYASLVSDAQDGGYDV